MEGSKLHPLDLGKPAFRSLSTLLLLSLLVVEAAARPCPPFFLAAEPGTSVVAVDPLPAGFPRALEAAIFGRRGDRLLD